PNSFTTDNGDGSRYSGGRNNTTISCQTAKKAITTSRTLNVRFPVSIVLLSYIGTPQDTEAFEQLANMSNVFGESWRLSHRKRPWTWQVNGNNVNNPPRRRRHHKNAVCQKYGFDDAVSNEENRLRVAQPYVLKLEVQFVTRHCIKGAERLVHE